MQPPDPSIWFSWSCLGIMKVHSKYTRTQARARTDTRIHTHAAIVQVALTSLCRPPASAQLNLKRHAPRDTIGRGLEMWWRAPRGSSSCSRVVSLRPPHNKLSAHCTPKLSFDGQECVDHTSCWLLPDKTVAVNSDLGLVDTK
jgi:hypothetical protein